MKMLLNYEDAVELTYDMNFVHEHIKDFVYDTLPSVSGVSDLLYICAFCSIYKAVAQQKQASPFQHILHRMHNWGRALIYCLSGARFCVAVCLTK